MFSFTSIGVSEIGNSPLSQAESSQSSSAENIEKAGSSSSARITESPIRVSSSKKQYCSSSDGASEDDDGNTIVDK